jgi:Bacterial Ig-like domain/Bacterial Ig domain/Bacterial TSP3 repeat
MTSYLGYETFDVSDPTAMSLLGATDFNRVFSFKQIVVNGSGLGVAAEGVTQNDDGNHHVSIYDVRDPRRTTRFVTTLATPGVAHAVSIYNGLAYVADGAAGLQVVNYLAFDTGGVAPTIALSASFPLDPAVAEEGQIVRVTAQVDDDVQVRNVEFYVDDRLVLADGAFPFECRFVAPLLSEAGTFSLRARATDTGGNATWTERITVRLSRDLRAPTVLGTFPGDGVVIGALNHVAATFSEVIDPGTLSSDSFQVTAVGPDGRAGTVDDQRASGTFSYNAAIRTATLTFSTNLPPGGYSFVVAPPLSDTAGNLMVEPFRSRFWVAGGLDTDQDGIPDDLEQLLGLDAANPDSNANGVWDGDEDFDGDGLRNSWEIVWGLSPNLADSDSNQIDDGAEDADLDSLVNLREQAFRTNPLVADTDGDGWPDETEVTARSNPLQERSRPRLHIATARSIRVKLPSSITPAELSVNVIVAKPMVRLQLPASVEPVFVLNTIIARPPIELMLTNTVEAGPIPGARATSEISGP